MSSAGTVLLQLQAAPIPGNMLQGAGRQHDTFAGNADSFLSLSYTVRHR